MPGGTGGAAVSAERALRLDAASGYTLSFSNDSSGVLAALGVNSFFGGSDASDLSINAAIEGDPRLLAAGQGHIDGSNGGALAIAGLEEKSLDSLGGRSLRGFWQSATTGLAVKTQAANTKADSTRLVRESLDAQTQATSGVSLDEESINMLSYQRQFQAAARYIATIDETLQTLLSIT
jgi:flagellar hook-associated protein 1 FlgK